MTSGTQQLDGCSIALVGTIDKERPQTPSRRTGSAHCQLRLRLSVSTCSDLGLGAIRVGACREQFDPRSGRVCDYLETQRGPSTWENQHPTRSSRFRSAFDATNARSHRTTPRLGERHLRAWALRSPRGDFRYPPWLTGFRMGRSRLPTSRGPSSYAPEAEQPGLPYITRSWISCSKSLWRAPSLTARRCSRIWRSALATMR